MLSGSMSFMSINAPARIFVTSFPGIGGKMIESSIGSSSLVALSADTAGGIAGSKSPMGSRGTVRIVSGGGSRPSLQVRGGGTFKTISKVLSPTCMCVGHCINTDVLLACLTSAFVDTGVVHEATCHGILYAFCLTGVVRLNALPPGLSVACSGQASVLAVMHRQRPGLVEISWWVPAQAVGWVSQPLIGGCLTA